MCFFCSCCCCFYCSVTYRCIFRFVLAFLFVFDLDVESCCSFFNFFICDCVLEFALVSSGLLCFSAQGLPVCFRVLNLDTYSGSSVWHLWSMLSSFSHRFPPRVLASPTVPSIHHLYHLFHSMSWEAGVHRARGRHSVNHQTTIHTRSILRSI